MVAVTQTQATASHLAVTDTRASQDWVSRELDQHGREFVVVRRLREASLDALSSPCPGRAALQTSGYWLTAACAVLEDLLGARGHRPRPAATRDPGRAAGRMSYARMAADGQLPTRGRAQGAVTTPNGGRSQGRGLVAAPADGGTVDTDAGSRPTGQRTRPRPGPGHLR